MNFNNTINSFITLFYLLIGSNWHIITSMHYIFYGNSFVRFISYYLIYFVFKSHTI